MSQVVQGSGLKRLINDRDLSPYFLILPSIIFFSFIFIWPLSQAVVQSLDVRGVWSLKNFQMMVGDLNFKAALYNTFALVIIVVPIQVCLALLMAVTIQKATKSRNTLLFLWTIPLGISDIAAGLVWLSILSERGYLNTILFSLGIIDGPESWLTPQTPITMFVAVVMAEVWRATSLVFVILVAGLQLIPKEYSEAGSVFGASPWKIFTKITLPLLKPSLQVAVVLRVIFAFEVFAMVFALAGLNMPVLAGEAYNWLLAYNSPGVASAYALLILMISFIAVIILFWLIRTNEAEKT